MKVSDATSDTIVGLFVLIAISGFVALTFFLRDDLFGGTYLMKASFQSVSGLEYGSPVLVSGIRKGRVVSIDYQLEGEVPMFTVRDSNGVEVERIPQPVIVTMRLSDDITIYSDGKISLAQQGFIGDKRVEIAPGTPEMGIPIGEDSPPMMSEPVFDLENIFKKADNIASDIQLSVASLREFSTDDANLKAIRDTVRDLNKSVNKVYEYLEENQTNVAEAIANIKVVSANLKDVSERTRIFMEADGRFDQISADVEVTMEQLRADIKDVMAETKTTVENFRSTLGNLDQRSERLTNSAVTLMDATKDDVAVLSANLEEATANLNVIIARIRRGEGTVGRFMTDPQPFEDLKDSISAVRGFLLGEQREYYDLDIRYRGTAGDDQLNLAPAVAP
ncbi:MAG: MlaD family protein [Candidatus Sumerlaeia bacterium]|nr:MlaD family protein [Candidatus Sumerlaeia bacterium]